MDREKAFLFDQTLTDRQNGDCIFVDHIMIKERNAHVPFTTWPGIHQSVIVLESPVWDFQMAISQ